MMDQSSKGGYYLVMFLLTICWVVFVVQWGEMLWDTFNVPLAEITIRRLIVIGFEFTGFLILIFGGFIGLIKGWFS